jgi:hypothetical protein
MLSRAPQLNPFYKVYRLPMDVYDALVLSNVISTITNNFSYWRYSNAASIAREQITPNLYRKVSLMLHIGWECYGVPVSNDHATFPYTAKELLAYLYDKIESN